VNQVEVIKLETWRVKSLQVHTELRFRVTKFSLDTLGFQSAVQLFEPQHTYQLYKDSRHDKACMNHIQDKI
jgi:hypothetical protein